MQNFSASQLVGNYLALSAEVPENIVLIANSYFQ